MTVENVSELVSERYARAAATGEHMCCPTGYDFDDLKSFIPEEVLKISYGCGTPAGLDTVRPGETVLDIGSGGGIDCFEAARRVGSSGRVIGIDMTDTMLAIARTHASAVAANLGYHSSNVEFRKGMADTMPVEDATVDLIISNCVINLAPDKRKVFREMFRVLRPGGRFTISDIVSDQTVPQYLVHDTEKWGNCLSGALPVTEYVGGMVEAGFLGIHSIKSIPWQSIDGIHFLSVTLTGYKLPPTQDTTQPQYATLRGPFSQVTDEFGHCFRRGMPEQINASTAQLLSTSSCHPFFILTDKPTTLDAADPRWIAILPEQKPCMWTGDYVILTGPFVEARDDDQHIFQRGIPLEICSKTLTVLDTGSYRSHFALYNRASGGVSGSQVVCTPTGGCC